MADEFERVMSLMLDRMEAKLKEIEASKNTIDVLLKVQKSQSERIDELDEAFMKARLDENFAKKKIDHIQQLLDMKNMDGKKLSKLWKAADAIRAKANNDVTAADRQRLAKALDDAQAACDQIPF